MRQLRQKSPQGQRTTRISRTKAETEDMKMKCKLCDTEHDATELFHSNSQHPEKDYRFCANCVLTGKYQEKKN
jgi:late competence protein required for DNA uptake (superfamily II DNA/RNA helicase)